MGAAAREQEAAAARRAQFQQLEQERTFHENVIAEKEAGIRDIEKTVLEVNDIFKDLSNLVADRGELVDSIAANIETGAVNTEKGVKELGKASNYQKKARSKMCCL